MRVLFFRDFADYDDNGDVYNSDGHISITITKNNFIEVVIERLHDWGEGTQAFMCIKYAPDFNLYDCVLTILNQITNDLELQYGEGISEKGEEPYYKDFIILSDKEMHAEIWNCDTNKNSIGGIWLPFTRENMKYVSIEDPLHEDFHTSITDGVEDAALVIRGEVAADGNFTYDYPILGSSDTIEMYRESRGKIDYYSTLLDSLSGEIRRTAA